ncbi:unnamed protein product [Adineta ricciae]|uniref:Uncharacterized protein n=3 Tax=Adineta ricciae TaxID=249248 RepID=A0A814YS50_ADIRI|nr:unnamed protein product [Adineta ricciae]
MWTNILCVLVSCVNITLAFQGRLFGVDTSSIRNTSFVQILDNSPKYDRLLYLNRASFAGPATATRNIHNETYSATYYTSDSFGVPHYFLFTIDVKKPLKLLNNVSINGPGYGSFWQIADDETRLVGIRESAHSGASLEVAALDQTTGRVNTIGLYPYGSYSLVMGFARQRRIYYNVIEALFCGVNVDTGKLDVQIRMPNDYVIYALIYDPTKDRLISIVYSGKIVDKAWFIASIIVDTSSSTLKFERIGNSVIPMDGNHFWSTTYTLAVKERQWITLWSTGNTGDGNTLITFDIDTGDIVHKQTINNSKYLNNLVYFD